MALQTSSSATIMTMNPRRNWAERLENVLDDYDALQVPLYISFLFFSKEKHFKNWMGVDDDSSEHPLRLHFAIKAFHERSESGDLRSAPLAREIYVKFLKPRSGLCAFIDADLREEIGRRVANLLKAPENFTPNLFDLCLPDLYKFLRHQHALFISSQEFLDFFNASVMGVTMPIGQCVEHGATNNVGFVQNPSYECTNVALNSSASLKSFVTPTKLFSNNNNNFGSSQAFDNGFATTSRRLKKPIVDQSQQQQQQQQSQQPTTTKLTASSLFRSQRDRETTLGQSLVEKLYKSVNKYPYIGQATTSKNDSAVSSSFSSDANGSHHSGTQHHHHHNDHQQQQHYRFYPSSQNHQTSKALRNEQRRLNPTTTNNFFLRLESQQICANPSNQFDHSTKEGRVAFNKVLTRKLLKVIEMREADEEVERIANKQIPKSTREMIISSEQKAKFIGDETTKLIFSADGDDENDEASLDAVDDDVDNYFRCRMITAACDSSTMNSQQQTPPATTATATALNDASTYQQSQPGTSSLKQKSIASTNKRPTHKSPEQVTPFVSANGSENLSRFNPSQHFIAHCNYSNQQQQLMSQSFVNTAQCYNTLQNKQNQVAFTDGLHQNDSTTVAKTGRLMSKQQQQQQQQTAHCYGIDGFSNTVIPSTSKVMTQSYIVCPYSNSNPIIANAAVVQQHPVSSSSSTTTTMTTTATTTGNKHHQRHRVLGFAPPPGKSTSASPYKDIYCDNDGDTSGIGTLTYISDASANSELLKKQRAAVFKKARELNAANSSGSVTTNAEPTTIKPDLDGNDEFGNELVFKMKDLTSSLSQTRNDAQQLEPVGQQITISYRHIGNSGSGTAVPMVANVIVENGLTFKEFRRHLSIPSRHKCQFFFQTVCEDGSAPYQLLLVNNDATILPIFEGKITAECRSLSDSE